MRYILINTLFICVLLSEKLPNDVRWVVNSKEYEALCHQVYNQAKKDITDLNNIFKTTYYYPNNPDLNLGVVVMDLDETVLDNSQYQIELYEKNETFNMESWAAWVEREEAELVPGVYDYISLLREYNIKIIFISNRMHERLKATKNNMRKLNIFSDNDIYLLRKDKQDKKDVRREEIYTATGRMKNQGPYRVIQYFGDAMGDFPDKGNDKFGVDQFILPNPMYGKW